MNVPDFALPILTIFQPAFSRPTYNRFLVLLLGALLTTGRRTITNVLRTVRQQAPGHVSSSHRVFSQRHWSTWTLARGMMTFLCMGATRTEAVTGLYTKNLPWKVASVMSLFYATRRLHRQPEVAC
jgi:hypothetical protein